MPRKIRELNADLRRAGLTPRPGKGDHTVWEHPALPRPLVVDGQEGDDAKAYQEQQLRRALAVIRRAGKGTP